MAATIRLTVLTGPHRGNRYCFRGDQPAMIGRSTECQICVCGEQRDLTISRRHCQLDFRPPNVRVADLGSSNGTYVNGQKADPIPPAEKAIQAEDGDLLTLGGTTFRINVMTECEECLEGGTVRVNCPVGC